ncbi:MAG: hypothetical protein AAGG08_10930 [Actinomycetota bacterium]
MRWFRRRRKRPAVTPPQRDVPDRDLNDPSVHTPGTFIDSWANMPGGQPDEDHRPNVSDLHGRS